MSIFLLFLLMIINFLIEFWCLFSTWVLTVFDNYVCYSYLFWIFIYLLLILFIFVKCIRCCGGARGWGWPFTWWHGPGISILFTLFLLNQYYCCCNCCSCSMLLCSNLCYKLIILFCVCVLVIMFVCNEWVIIDKIKMTSMLCTLAYCFSVTLSFGFRV